MIRPSNVHETQLGAWMRAATIEEREELARYCRTNVSYLKLLAGVHRENPKLRLAMAIIQGIAIINHRHDVLVPQAEWYPKVTLADLASPTRKPEYAIPMEFLCKE